MNAHDVKTIKRPSEEALALMDTIQHKISRMFAGGLEPRRVFMNYRTKLILMGGPFHRSCVIVIPRGQQRIDTVLGLDIHIVDSLPDGFVDIGADEQY
jgi:hypothetical protein